ncbi:MAG: alpha/beta hydrolase [Eubacteriales bacterium]|nr:alpha/beta hydrolase [Eubacteriales bacterium]
MTKARKQRVPRRFYVLTALIYLPVFYSLAVIGAHWYGFVIVGLSFCVLMGYRRWATWKWWHMLVCLSCAFLVAFGGLTFSRPRWDVSLPGQVGAGTLRTFTKLPLDEGTRSGEVFSDVELWKAPEGYTYGIVELPTCKLEVLTRNEGRDDVAVLQLHGGAFVAGLNDLYRTFARRFCDLTDGGTVYTLDYRLAPTYPYPSQQNDVRDAWNYLTKTLGYQPGRIIVTGDSAGGNLVLNLGLRLRDEGEPMPMALIGFSPWADLSNSGESHIENATKDPTFGIPEKDFDGVTPVGVSTTYPDGLDAKNPYLSPTYGDYSGFPPMLLQAGELEVLLSDSEIVYQNAISHGVDCTFTIYPGMFHVFQGSLDLLPESKSAWGEVASFIQRMMNLYAPTN